MSEKTLPSCKVHIKNHLRAFESNDLKVSKGKSVKINKPIYFLPRNFRDSITNSIATTYSQSLCKSLGNLETRFDIC